MINPSIHVGSPPPLPQAFTSSVDSRSIYPTQDTKLKVPISCTWEVSKTTLAEQNAMKAAALTAVQQITYPPPQYWKQLLILLQ